MINVWSVSQMLEDTGVLSAEECKKAMPFCLSASARISKRLRDVKFEDEIRPNIAGPSITMAPRSQDTVASLPLPQPQPDKGFFYRNFAFALEGKEPLTVPPEQTLRVMQIIDMAFASGEANQVLFCDI